MSLPGYNLIGTTTKTVQNLPYISSAIYSQYFNPNGSYYYNADGTYKGDMNQLQCEELCLFDTKCKGYSLKDGNNGNYNCYLTYNDNIKYASGNGNFIKDSSLNNSPYTTIRYNYKNNLLVPDDYETIYSLVNNNVLNFKTMCRSTDGSPIGASSKGYLTPFECAYRCSIDPNCTSFDLARGVDGKYDCYNFTINRDKVYGAQGDQGGAGCFKKIKPDYLYNGYYKSYNFNNWMVYHGNGSPRNQYWYSKTYVNNNKNNLNNAAQKDFNTVSNVMVTYIIDIGSWDFTSIDIYIRTFLNNPVDISQFNLDNLTTLNALYSNYPLLSVGTHDIWITPQPDFNKTPPPVDIGLGYLTNNGISPLTVFGKYNMTSELYTTLPDNSKVYKLKIYSNVGNKKRYIVISHGKCIKSSLLDVVFN